MSDSSQQNNSSQPPSTPQQRRLEAIRRCTEGALSSAQKCLEDKYMSPSLSRVLDNYMGGFKRYLPEICDYETACDFIACVAYGMSIEAISLVSGSKLLYAGQIAVSALRPPRETGRPAKNTPTPTPDSTMRDGAPAATAKDSAETAVQNGHRVAAC